MGEAVQRGVALGPGGLGNKKRYAPNRRYFAEAGCAWVRLWADWPTLQPSPEAPPDLRGLDADIAAARADGLKVMLTAYRFARWANGTSQVTPEQDVGFETQDRILPGDDPAQRKELTFRVPDDVSEASAWGKWIALLVDRYRQGGSGGEGRWIEALEIFNEPNLQFWPQQAPSPDPANPYAPGKLIVHQPAARMMVTARTILSARAGAPVLVAPALSDRVGGGRLDTGYDQFADALLDELDRLGFKPDARVAWSHHSYTDFEGDTAERTADMRRRLVGRWPGWPTGDATAPGLMITETGVRLTKVAQFLGSFDGVAIHERQSALLERGWERLRTGPAGDGVDIVMHYLFITDIFYDAGLCDLDGTPRPAYFLWADLPTVR